MEEFDDVQVWFNDYAYLRVPKGATEDEIWEAIEANKDELIRQAIATLVSRDGYVTEFEVI